MAKYTFFCETCGTDTIKYVPHLVKDIVCECGANALRDIPQISGPATVTEVIDPYTNVNLSPDNDEILKDRSSEHFWKNEVPRLIQQYPVEHSLQEGWLYLDEKGHIQTQTKSPHKR